MSMSTQSKLAIAKAGVSEVERKALSGESGVKVGAVSPPERTPGTGKGIRMTPDFDAPLGDFAKYM